MGNFAPLDKRRPTPYIRTMDKTGGAMEAIDRFRNSDGEIDFRAWLNNKPIAKEESSLVSLDPVENAYRFIDAKLEQKIKDWVEPQEAQLTRPMSRLFSTLMEGMYRRHRMFMLSSPCLLYPGDMLLDAKYRAKNLKYSLPSFTENVRRLEAAGLLERYNAGRFVIVRLLPFYIPDEPPVPLAQVERITNDSIAQERLLYSKHLGGKQWREDDALRRGERKNVIRQIIADYQQLYKEKFHTWPIRKYGADEKAANKVLDLCGTNRNKVMAVFREYFVDDSTWLVAQKHPLWAIPRRLPMYIASVESVWR